YTCTVTHLNSNGESVSEVYSNLTQSSSIYISSPCTIIIGSGAPPSGTTLYFTRWNSNGSATISSPTSCSTSVSNFTANINIGASYQ
ncbi:MAG: hypothetical protein JXJ04_05875, partial [Spirochaetales bacterium]|nr:hypothetical protein [Spirochaetales bacterium]